MSEETTRQFRHDSSFIVLGICGHWWQTRDYNELVLTDCPECGRPPSHALAPDTGGIAYMIIYPPSCGVMWRET